MKAPRNDFSREIRVKGPRDDLPTPIDLDRPDGMTPRTGILKAKPPDEAPRFPQTRYQGSKLKLLPWMMPHLAALPCETVLDAFGGTGCVSYAFKQAGKSVTYNDALAFNTWIGRALIENNHERLDAETLASLFEALPSNESPAFIQETFGGIYYTDAENQWLDGIIPRIRRL